MTLLEDEYYFSIENGGMTGPRIVLYRKRTHKKRFQKEYEHLTDIGVWVFDNGTDRSVMSMAKATLNIWKTEQEDKRKSAEKFGPYRNKMTKIEGV